MERVGVTGLLAAELRLMTAPDASQWLLTCTDMGAIISCDAEIRCP
jgi:hypothetical protein